MVDNGRGVELGELHSSTLVERWSVLLYWPSDFGSVCPELLDAVAETASAASATFLVATTGVTAGELAEEWRRRAPRLRLPVAVDERRELAAALGLAGADRHTGRVTIVVDSWSRVRWVNLSDISPLKDLRQALSVLRALRFDAVKQHVHAGAAEPEALIAMCAWCRRVRDDGGWHSQEIYIRRRTGNDFTHGICGECMGGFADL